MSTAGEPLKPPLIFGVPARWEAFHKRNVAFLDAWDRLHKLIERVFVRQLTNSSQNDLHVLYLGRLCVEDFLEILLLCGNGYGLAGMKLLRGLFERALTGWYLHKHTEESANFEDYWHVQNHRLAREAREKFGDDFLPEKLMADLKARADAVRGRFMIPDCAKCETTKLNHSWTRMDVVSMARECPEIGEYLLPAYWDTLAHVHANFGGIMLRLDVVEDSIGFRDESPAEECDGVLVTAHALLLRVLDLQIRHFRLDDEDQHLGRCVDDFETIWGKPPGSGKEQSQ